MLIGVACVSPARVRVAGHALVRVLVDLVVVGLVRDGRRLHRVGAHALAVVVLGVDERRGLRLLLERYCGTQRVVLGERCRTA